MASKKLDPAIAEVLKKHGHGPEACWDSHGAWVVYHRVLEQIAASAGVQFDPPAVIESDSQSGVVAICVTGRIGDRMEWSIGEAAPKNNKNAYPYAMAEKRAKDRVIIKLVGLHGLHSEDEADDFKPPAQSEPPSSTQAKPTASAKPPAAPAKDTRQAYFATAQVAIEMANDATKLKDWWKEQAPNRREAGLTQPDVDDLRAMLSGRLGELEKPMNHISAG